MDSTERRNWILVSLFALVMTIVLIWAHVADTRLADRRAETYACSLQAGLAGYSESQTWDKCR